MVNMASEKWYVFGPAAVCLALARPLPQVVDVYFKYTPPEPKVVTSMLGAHNYQQIRSVNIFPDPIVTLDCVRLEPEENVFRIEDEYSILNHKRVDILRFDFAIENSLRLHRMVHFFPEFTWPDYLIRKLDADFEYAIQVSNYDDSVRLLLSNLDFDFETNSSGI
jgi:hypothetical protein